MDPSQSLIGKTVTPREFVIKDHEARKGQIGYLRFNWFRAVNPDGLRVTFRYPKGFAVDQFDQYVRDKHLHNVEGPFKTRKAAQIS